MFFWKKKKEEITFEEFSYTKFAVWLNEILKNPLPVNVKGINFNLYEEEKENTFGVQFVATSSFDSNDDDWACDEVFSSNENMYYFTNENGWEQTLKEVEKNVKTYLEKEEYSSVLKKMKESGLVL